MTGRRQQELTIVITAHNEAENLGKLVQHLGSRVGVCLIDDYSTDESGDVVSGHANWRIYKRRYQSQADQLNWALDTVVDTPWVFVLDADERILGGLASLYAALDLALHEKQEAVAFRRRNFFGTVPLRHGGFYPDWQVRLFRSSLRYETGLVHSHVSVSEESIKFSDAELLHQTYTSVEQYIRKYGDYLVREALQDRFDSSRPRYRRLRKMGYRVPFPGLARFIYDYGFRQGFRDGRFGYYSALWAGYRASIAAGRRRLATDARLDGKVIDDWSAGVNKD